MNINKLIIEDLLDHIADYTDSELNGYVNSPGLFEELVDSCEDFLKNRVIVEIRITPDGRVECDLTIDPLEKL